MDQQMATRRRESALELADALGVRVEAGEPTSDLMDRLIEHARGAGAREERAERDEREAEPSERATRPRKRRGSKREGQACLALVGDER